MYSLDDSLMSDSSDEPPGGRVNEELLSRLLSSSSDNNRLGFESEYFYNTDKPKRPLNDRSKDFIERYYSPHLSDRTWNDWRWQIRNSIVDYDRLESMFGEAVDKSGLVEKKLPFRITPYYASVVKNSKPLQKTVIPSINELIVSDGEAIDPLKEDCDSPVKRIVHRYPDRVLFLATNFCSTNCRYCTRSRIVSNNDFFKKQTVEWERAFKYIRERKEIRDIIISGGDPLTLPDISLNYLLNNIFSIPHIEMVRIGTKVPAVVPMRINKRLIKILKNYKPLYMSIHFTHPDEITEEVSKACNMLADAGIVMGSQTVLLKEVNDNPQTIKSLFHKLLKIRVKPYYLYQCDPIMGSSHFRTPVEKGIEIIDKLRGWTSGYAIPHYVIDAPGGGGKIPLLPDYYRGRSENGAVLLRNYENNRYSYPDYNLA
ncbi:MAG TPA: KamA family radical SAM protein [Spirochaetota bacterium]|nr:KamA family radical SAM protein [Spirochaetota bacterium]HOS32140.1 KamA family radical SAM protein [Spirochaetota bacterium]HOS54584.1 KamA family radical SAM protein [Spirochaetota bacterium]HPK60897.1 KamA family radical SAM protein [Spirochaetota bacterium]HQF77082.1 KamA family radical SAM protein [Spirochaetota bacterium]